MDDFTALYRKYAPDVFRFALYLSGERTEAEDIAAETFVRLWAAPREVEMATVKAYLFTIARNLFLQRLRKRSQTVDLDRDLRDEQPDPEMQAAQKEELRNVIDRLQGLPEPDRAALLMRAMHDLPYEEIARAIGASVGAAKVKVHRARLALAGLRAGGGDARAKG